VRDYMVPSVVHCKRDPYDVYIGRPSKWGNPFSHKNGTKAEHLVGSREEAIVAYHDWLVSDGKHLIEQAKIELKGKTLGCWCSPKPCHGDILVMFANEGDASG